VICALGVDVKLRGGKKCRDRATTADSCAGLKHLNMRVCVRTGGNLQGRRNSIRSKNPPPLGTGSHPKEREGFVLVAEEERPGAFRDRRKKKKAPPTSCPLDDEHCMKSSTQARGSQERGELYMGIIPGNR